VREDDWGSIIAFTVSTADYARELASMSVVQRGSGASSLASPQPVLTPAVLNDRNSSASSFFSAKQLFTASTQQVQPDPDQDDTVWYEPEAYSAVISRKEHPRDATSLLSLREVLRQKSPTLDGVSIVGGSSSRFSSLGSAATKGSGTSGLVPPSAWSKPDVQISRHAVGGEVSMSGSGEATAEEVGRILHEIEASSGEGRPASALAGSFFADMHVWRGKAASVISMDSDTTVDGRSKEGDDAEDARHGKEGSSATEVPAAPTPTPSSFTNTLTSGISSAMRLLLSNGKIPRPSMFSKNRHGLLAPAIVDAFAIDERPHIKYDWTVGKRLKFSCTVYYARQFDNLRRRCGIENVFVKSLSRSANWAAEDGKSKSNFWKTADDRFIIKTLVNPWNVVDL
jgi:1-phosphatidylinositol-3-phosphate 5-kinase